MIEFGGQKTGHPWHGLYRQSTGKITTPAGGDIDLPGAEPDGGDVLPLVVPGMPTVSTTPTEAAAGQTWMNTARICGRNRVLYGLALGEDSHIYIDAAKKAWLVRVVVSASRSLKVFEANVWIKPFGRIGTELEDWTVIEPVVCSFETHPDYPFASDTVTPNILDINSAGSKVLVGAVRTTIGMSAVAELSLSGSPATGDFLVSIATIYDEASVESWPVAGEPVLSWRRWVCWWSEFVPCPPPDPLPEDPVPGGYYYDFAYYYDGSSWYDRRAQRVDILSAMPANYQGDEVAGTYLHTRTVSLYQRTWTQRALAGARYGVAGAEAVTIERSHSITQSATLTEPEPWEQLLPPGPVRVTPPIAVTRDAEQVSSLSVMVGAQASSYELQINRTETGNLEIYLDVPWGMYTYSATDYYTTSDGGSASVTVSGSPTGIGVGPQLIVERPPPAFDSTLAVTAIRYSNSVHGLRSKPFDLTSKTYDNSQRIYGPALGVGGSANTWITVAATATLQPWYATGNPDTGEVVRSTSVVCWV